MKLLALLLVFGALAACPSANEKALGADNDEGGAGGGAPPPHICSRDTDCTLSAATCCECPTFAVSQSDPALRACAGVMCPGKDECPANVEAQCTDGDCVLACAPLVCAQTFAAGYAIDPATGCLSCEAAVPDSGGCARDSECVETRADCCGCHAGGSDTAVLASLRASYDAELGCPSSPSCPAVNVCEAGAAPHCVQGRCELVSTTGIQDPICGRTDLPACPAGLVCTINRDPQASLLGVGVCVSP